MSELREIRFRIYRITPGTFGRGLEVVNAPYVYVGEDETDEEAIKRGAKEELAQLESGDYVIYPYGAAIEFNVTHSVKQTSPVE